MVNAFWKTSIETVILVLVSDTGLCGPLVPLN